MIYHLIDAEKYNVSPRTDGEHTWVDFRNYNPANANVRAVVKDMIDSDNFLRTVIKFHNPTKNRLFHMFGLAKDDKSFFVTDAALNMFPTPDERLSIAIRAADWAMANNQIGTDDVVWFLNHSGHYSEKNKTSVESYQLVEEYKKQGKTQCGCGQLDSALCGNTRKLKQSSDVNTDAKIIVVNDINEGNSIVKSFLLNGWHGMGFLVGADVPVVLNSRSNLYMNDKALELLGLIH